MESKPSNQTQFKTTLNDSFYKITGWHLRWSLVAVTLLILVIVPSVLLVAVFFDFLN